LGIVIFNGTNLIDKKASGSGADIYAKDSKT
jgi:hypothetical protein